MAVAILASWVLFRTKVGLNLRAVGESPATADAVGINVTRYKYAATCIGSGIAGLGGFYYIIDYMASQEAYLSIEAFGWLSIALVIFALWRPHLTILGSTVFGLLFSCSSCIANIPGVQLTMAAKPLLKMLPYVVTIIVLINHLHPQQAGKPAPGLPGTELFPGRTVKRDWAAEAVFQEGERIEPREAALTKRKAISDPVKGFRSSRLQEAPQSRGASFCETVTQI